MTAVRSSGLALRPIHQEEAVRLLARRARGVERGACDHFDTMSISHGTAVHPERPGEAPERLQRRRPDA